MNTCSPVRAQLTPCTITQKSFSVSLVSSLTWGSSRVTVGPLWAPLAQRIPNQHSGMQSLFLRAPLPRICCR